MTLLREKYNSIAAGEQGQARTSIMKECGFNERTFYRKLDHPDSVRLTERRIFSKYLGVPEGKLFPVSKKKVIVHQDDQD